MQRKTPPRFRKNLLALAAGAALVPHSAWAIDLVQAPPGTVQPYVAPNVIISIDDSGSMDWQINSTSSGSSSILTPNPDGSWDTRAKRINVLKYALNQVFTNTTLLPDKKIRLSWQAMWNNGGSPSAGSVDSTSMNTNSMRPLQGTHRTNFLNFASNLKANNGTPSHLMFKQADAYMRRSLTVNSPWALDPGNTGAPYLGCRRNYHILMTDGRWNGTAYAVGDANYTDNATNLLLPDGSNRYGGTTADQAKTKLYRDSNATTTLADWAFYSWAKPLQTTGLTGTIEPQNDYRQAPATENFGNDLKGKPAILERFWNPRYDPATWPHMVTFTIGVSNDATTWPFSKYLVSPTQTVPYGYDKSFLDLVTGNQSWPTLSSNDDSQNNDHAVDLWHAALNGRGRYYAIMKGEDLQKAFEQIIGQINTDTQPDLTSTATSGSNVSRNDVGKFTGNYEPAKAWKGYVTAETVKKDGTTVPTPGWNGQNTADKLDAMAISQRIILSWSDQWVTVGTTSKEKGGVPFKWASDQTNLSTAQKALLTAVTAPPAPPTGMVAPPTGTTGADGQSRVDYLRGDRTKECPAGGCTTTQPFRQRQSRQGDIINSVVWYTGAPASNYSAKGYAAFTTANKSRTPVLYVGGNDGLLHGFSATDGTELIAYAPRGVIATLPQLTSPSYSHMFFVDGSPMTGDVDLGTVDPADPTTYTPDWRTVLVGTMGAGGKGYFVLDVTNPTSTDSTDSPTKPGFTESNANKLVMLDRTRGADGVPNCAAMTDATQKAACNTATEEDKDIGNITARPVLDDNNPMRTTQITRMNNDRWAVVMGNGYNSTNQRAVLLIQYLDGAKELVRLPTTTEFPGTGQAKDNGLSAPRLIDLNGDGRPDVAYAGDNLGNMWKFDLTSVSDANWGVAALGTSPNTPLSPSTPPIAPNTASAATAGGSAAKPLFSAQGPAALGGGRTIAQPITAAPTVRANDRTKTVGTGASAKTVSVGGMMVAFGTGRNVTLDDTKDINVQTLYSVLDNTRYRTVSTAKGPRLEVHPGAGTCPNGSDCVPAPTALGTGVTNAKLAQQTLDSTNTIINVVDAVDWTQFNGWYLDLPDIGERLLKPIEFYDGSNILAVYSQVPAKGSDTSSGSNPNVESCTATTVDEERQNLTLVNIMDGKRPTVQLLDTDGNGIFYSKPPSGPNPCPTCGDDKFASRRSVTKGSHTVIKSGSGGNCLNMDIDSSSKTKFAMACMPEQSLRPSWRQLK